MNRLLLYIGCGVTLSLLALYFYFNSREYVVTIPEQTIREKLDERLPFSKTYFFFFEITLANPRLALDSENNRVATGLDLVLNMQVNDNKKPLGGSVDVSGTIRYVSEEGSFYLSDPSIENLSIDGIPDKYKSKASAVIEKALTHFYSTRPIYTLKAGDVKQAAAKIVLKSLKVQEKNIVVTLGI